MKFDRLWLWGVLIAAFAVSIAPVAEASTFVRAGLDHLTAQNDSVLIAEAKDARSYWNASGDLMLTDITLEVLEVLKGKEEGSEITVTLMGGSIGDLSTVILGGAELVPGNSYVLFVDTSDLPGAASIRTVKDHAQGVFDIVAENQGLKAVSQAKDLSLVADEQGKASAPFGQQGISLAEISDEIRALVLFQEEKP